MSPRTLIIARGLAVMTGTVALVAGGTFAASWQDTATFSANTISSGTANLQIAKPGDGQWNDSEAGYNYKLLPGLSAPYVIRLNNGGDVNLAVSLHVPTINAPGLNTDDVLVHVYAGQTSNSGDGGTDLAGGATLTSVENGDVTVGTINAGAPEDDFTLVLETKNGAITGGSINPSDPFDLVFTGTAAE